MFIWIGATPLMAFWIETSCPILNNMDEHVWFQNKRLILKIDSDSINIAKASTNTNAAQG